MTGFKTRLAKMEALSTKGQTAVSPVLIHLSNETMEQAAQRQLRKIEDVIFLLPSNGREGEGDKNAVET